MTAIRFYWGVYDAVSAAAVHEAGGEGLWLSGLCCSAVQGLPDTELAGLGDLLACLRTIRRASDRPLWVDCGTGFGSPANLAVAADDLRRAGATGVCFEDKVFPKRNTFAPVTHVLEEVPRFCEKIERAKRRLDASGCSVIARTEALAVGEPLAASLRRAAAYADAGADILFVSNPSRSIEDVREFLAAWQGRLPVVLLPTSYRLGDLDELEALGVAFVIYANQLLRSAVAAMRRLLERFRTDRLSVTEHAEMISVAELLGLADRRLL
jgi:phosphoenolpyruvate phosphomutase